MYLVGYNEYLDELMRSLKFTKGIEQTLHKSNKSCEDITYANLKSKDINEATIEEIKVELRDNSLNQLKGLEIVTEGKLNTCTKVSMIDRTIAMTTLVFTIISILIAMASLLVSSASTEKGNSIGYTQKITECVSVMEKHKQANEIGAYEEEFEKLQSFISLQGESSQNIKELLKGFNGVMIIIILIIIMLLIGIGYYFKQDLKLDDRHKRLTCVLIALREVIVEKTSTKDH